MTRYAPILVLVLSCSSEPATWSGVPAGSSVTCEFPSNGGTRRLCVANDVAYFCVADLRHPEPRHWHCAPIRSLAELEQP